MYISIFSDLLNNFSFYNHKTQFFKGNKGPVILTFPLPFTNFILLPTNVTVNLLTLT